TIYARARASPHVRGTIRFFRGKLLDAAEAALWRKVLEGESWAVRLALTEWGRSRGFSDGAEAWHDPQKDDDKFSPALLRRMISEVLNHNADIEDCRARQLDSDARPLCGQRQPGAVENGAAPGGDRPGHHRDDSGADGTDSGD
ncbi:MAG: hypothetical protein ACM3U2_20745, partial [Deltaproteobacteria bacterium]